MGFWVWVFVGISKKTISEKLGNEVDFGVLAFFWVLGGSYVKRVFTAKDLGLQQESEIKMIRRAC
jgi:hypothetical protein